jgi:hypothetical protein
MGVTPVRVECHGRERGRSDAPLDRWADDKRPESHGELAQAHRRLGNGERVIRRGDNADAAANDLPLDPRYDRFRTAAHRQHDPREAHEEFLPGFRRIDLFQLVERRAGAERSRSFAPDDHDRHARCLLTAAMRPAISFRSTAGANCSRVVERNGGDAVGNRAGDDARAERLRS